MGEEGQQRQGRRSPAEPIVECMLQILSIAQALHQNLQEKNWTLIQILTEQVTGLFNIGMLAGKMSRV